MTDVEKITEILKAYTKKHKIMASSVILEEYAEELVRNGVTFQIKDKGKTMTNNEIKKTCQDCVTFSPCSKKGDYLYRYKCTCSNFVDKNIFEERNRQKAEIERLQSHIQEGIDLAKQIPEMLAITKAEAIKEFAERLKEEIAIRPTYSKEQDREVLFYIDNLVKEMEGNGNG